MFVPYQVFHPNSPEVLPQVLGAGNRSRTCNLLITNQLRCQLRHAGICIGERTPLLLSPACANTWSLTYRLFAQSFSLTQFVWGLLAPPVGFEPTTPRLTAACSSQLSYGGVWQEQLDSNQRPPAYQTGTLPLSYTPIYCEPSSQIPYLLRFLFIILSTNR